ncbi:MAG: TadE/TadG family type IV pilus assembly protein [Rhizomicrobium sp.]
MRDDSRKGSAALEFGIIAPVFFILLLGIVENGVIFFAGSTLQYATDNAARYVRTGQAQAASMTQAQFRTRICNDIAPLLACDSNLQIDMQAYAGYGGATFSPPTDANGNVNPNLSHYQPGVACNVVLVRAFYTWKVLTPGLSVFLTNITGGYHLITATAAFRNEPFNVAVAGC